MPVKLTELDSIKWSWFFRERCFQDFLVFHLWLSSINLNVQYLFTADWLNKPDWNIVYKTFLSLRDFKCIINGLRNIFTAFYAKEDLSYNKKYWICDLGSWYFPLLRYHLLNWKRQGANIRAILGSCNKKNQHRLHHHPLHRHRLHHHHCSGLDFLFLTTYSHLKSCAY